MFERSADDRLLTGAAAGLGERLEVDPLAVRLAFVLLALAGGVGFIAYLVTMATSRDPDGAAPTVPARPTVRRTLGFAMGVAGVLLILREAGLWFGDGVVWPAALLVTGSVLLWGRADEGRSWWARFLPDLHGGPLRVAAGLALIGVGVSVFIVSSSIQGLLRNAGFVALALGVAGLVIVGPWVARLIGQLAEERRERIRSQERATISAHLHDSVLQTLASIQRTDDPRRMAALARTQERELRGWLYGRPVTGAPTTLSAAIDLIADEVEREHGVAIEAVTVGDAPLDDTIVALVSAAREALVNAAVHSGARSVSLFAEVESGEIEVFVRDQGVGFDRATVGPDRRGVVDSIEGRVRRAGGTASIVSMPGRGTEVTLRSPKAAP